MFKFSSLFFALALSQASASTIRSGRQLSEELFLTYGPQTTVTDHVSDTFGAEEIAINLIRRFEIAQLSCSNHIICRLPLIWINK